MSEALVRDILAKNLSVLEHGLELLEIEKYIPSTLGTRSFLDLLAKDYSGHWVIIEVKKTDAAAREAAHEVFKYIEAVQRHFGARKDEVRAIVAAVEWTELLIPFSRLVSETNLNVEGVRLKLSSDGESLTADHVETVAINQGRYLAPWHELNLYHNESSLIAGISSYDECCEVKGIKDYVLVILKAADDFNERAAIAIDAVLRDMKAMFGTSTEHADAPIANTLDRYEYILYFAPQIFSREFCLQVISLDSELLEEIKDSIENISEEAALCMLHENAYDTEPSPSRDYLEIGYAAKFKTKLLRDEGWKIEQVLRRGIFARNTLLTDEAIVEELSGSTGSSGQSFKRTISLANRAQIASARTDLASALATNPGWLAQINRALDDLSKEQPDAEAEISVFNPSSSVFTIYFLASQEDSTGYMPRYEILVRPSTGHTTRLYLGLLVPDGRPMSLDSILTKYYDGRMGRLMFLASAGYYETRDADVMEDLGLVYRTFRVDDPSGNMTWFELRNDRWRTFTPALPFQPLQQYFDANFDLIESIVKSIGSRMHGGFHDMS